MDIFISYSPKDHKLAAQLIERLSFSGLSILVDKQGMGGGDAWATKIVGGIQSCARQLMKESNG